jgi:hypothetical protein
LFEFERETKATATAIAGAAILTQHQAPPIEATLEEYIYF